MKRSLAQHLPRLYRLCVLVAAVWLIQGQHQRLKALRDPGLSLPEALPYFPTAVELGPRQPPYHTQKVLGSRGNTLGFLLHTAPEADHHRGYTGPSDVLLALDHSGRVIGASLRASDDTADHVRAIEQEPDFWQSFHGLALGAPGSPAIDAVSGSTLTCDAIIQSVIDRMGGLATSTLFPTDILVQEVQQFLPEARSMQPHPNWTGVQMIYDSSSRLIGHALRTAPSQEALLGYQGPSDMLILLDQAATKIVGLRFRKSYDNEEYYDRILADGNYLKTFDGLTVAEVAGVDYAARGIEGVSGATLTSWAFVEGVKRRLRALQADQVASVDSKLLDGRDYLLIFVTLGAVVMAFSRLRGLPRARTGWQIILVIVLGFLTGDLISQALLAGWAQHGIAWRDCPGLLFLVAAAFIIPWSTGKQLYCFHLCPHGAIQHWLQKLPLPNLKVPPSTQRWLSSLPLVLLCVVLGSVMLGLGVNLASLEAFDAYLFKVAGWISISVALVGLLASAFVPLAYCKYGCPTGLILKFVRWKGAADQFDRRDVIAGLLLVAVLAIRVGS